MARLALAVGYVTRGTSRTEQPVLLYLGTSFQAAKDAIHAPPDGIGYAEAYRLDAKATKFHHVPGFVVSADTAPNLELPAFLTEAPADSEPEEAEPEPEAEPDLDLGTSGKRRGGKP